MAVRGKPEVTQRVRPNVTTSSGISRSKPISSDKSYNTPSDRSNRKSIVGLSTPNRSRAISNVQSSTPIRSRPILSIQASSTPRSRVQAVDTIRSYTRDQNRFFSKKNIDGAGQRQRPQIEPITGSTPRSKPVVSSVGSNESSLERAQTPSIRGGRTPIGIGSILRKSNGPIRISDL